MHGAGKYPEGVREMIAALDGVGLVFIFAQNDLPGLKFADGWRWRLRGLWPDDRTALSEHVSVTVTPHEVEGVRVKDPADALKVLGPERFRSWVVAQKADYFWRSPIQRPVAWALQ